MSTITVSKSTNTKKHPLIPHAKYTHTVWGVDVNENPLVAVNGHKHFNSVPVPVYRKVTHI